MRHRRRNSVVVVAVAAVAAVVVGGVVAAVVVVSFAVVALCSSLSISRLGVLCVMFWVVFRCHNAGRGVLSYTARWLLGGCHNAVRMNIVRRARSECMCVRLLCSLFRRDHEQVVEKIMPVDNLRSGLIV